MALRDRTSDRLVRWALALEGAPIICDVEDEVSVDVGCLRSRHCLVTSESGIQLDPPVTQARLTLQAQVSSLMDAARRLPRLRASRFDALNNDDGDAYDDLLVEEDISSKTLTKALDAALTAIERRVTDCLAREKRWARHSGLWRLTVSDVARALDEKHPEHVKDYTYDSGARLDAWARCLEGAGASRRDADADLAFEEERRRGLSLIHI